MALPSFRKFETQAQYSVIASAAALVPLGAAIVSSAARFDPNLRAISFGQAGLFRLGFLTCVAAAVLLSVAGAGLGFNSAGQRRNKQDRRSWVGFFLGTAVLSLTIIVYVAFQVFQVSLVSSAPDAPGA